MESVKWCPDCYSGPFSGHYWYCPFDKTELTYRDMLIDPCKPTGDNLDKGAATSTTDANDVPG